MSGSPEREPEWRSWIDHESITARDERAEGTAFARSGGVTLLLTLVLVIVAVALVALVGCAGPSTSPPSTGPAATIAPSYTRAPATFPPVIDEVLTRAWVAGDYGCTYTGEAVDGLTAALEADIAEAPAEGARLTATRWLRERCSGA